MADTNTFYLKVGDTYPDIAAILKNGDGNPIDLLGATAKFRMSQTGGGNLLLEEDAVVDSFTTGLVSYAWQDGDTDVEGTYLAEWVVTFPGGRVATFPRGVTDGVDYNRVVIEPIVT